MKSNLNSGIAKQIKNSTSSNKENIVVKILKYKIPIIYSVCTVGFFSFGNNF